MTIFTIETHQEQDDNGSSPHTVGYYTHRAFAEDDLVAVLSQFPKAQIHEYESNMCLWGFPCAGG